MLRRDEASSLHEYLLALQFRWQVEIAFGGLLRSPDLERLGDRQDKIADPATRLTGSTYRAAAPGERQLGSPTYELPVQCSSMTRPGARWIGGCAAPRNRPPPGDLGNQATLARLVIISPPHRPR